MITCTWSCDQSLLVRSRACQHKGLTARKQARATWRQSWKHDTWHDGGHMEGYDKQRDGMQNGRQTECTWQRGTSEGGT
jgi:hypothetical protein